MTPQCRYSLKEKNHEIRPKHTRFDPQIQVTVQSADRRQVKDIIVKPFFGVGDL